MGKRTLLAFFLSFLVILSYNYYLSQKYPSAKEALPRQERESAFTSSALSEATFDQQPALPAQTTIQAEDVIVETDLVKLVITSSGARIKSYQLKRHPEEKIAPQFVQTQLEQIEMAQARASGQTQEALLREEQKFTVLLDKITTDSPGAELVSLAAVADGDFSPRLVFPDEPSATTALNTARYTASDSALKLSKERPTGQLRFVYTDERGHSITKIFSFSNSNYIIGLDIKLPGWKQKDFLLYYGPDIGLPFIQRSKRAYGYEGPIVYLQTRQESSATAPGGKSYMTERGWIQKEKYAREEESRFVSREHQGQVRWAGLENKYFLSAVIPTGPCPTVLVEKNKHNEQKVALKVPGQDTGEYNFHIYLGPKKEECLKQANASLEKSIDYGLFGPIARFIYQSLVFFSRWTNNFGWAIVLLCLATKVVFYPLTHHSFEAMQKMQQQMKGIQPETDALREKFRDNPQKLNKAVIELYRKKGINPLSSCQSGCLPLLLQMPVFFALYAVLYNSIELRGAHFIGWVSDLSRKDPYYILPVLMGLSTFLQQKVTGMGTTGGMQQEQAKMMTFFFPIFLSWIFASLPSGVVLYWLTFNLLTVLQQGLIKKISGNVSRGNIAQRE